MGRFVCNAPCSTRLSSRHIHGKSKSLAVNSGGTWDARFRYHGLVFGGKKGWDISCGSISVFDLTTCEVFGR